MAQVGSLNFFESRYPHKRFRSSALFRNLIAEISRRSAPEWKPASYAEVLKKEISRSDFEEWINSAVKDDPEEKLAHVRERLNSEHVDLKLWTVIERAWRTYVVGRMNQTDTTFQEFVAKAQQATIATWQAAQFVGLLGFLAEAESRFIGAFGEPLLPLSRELLKGAILFEYKSIESGQLQTVGAEPAT